MRRAAWLQETREMRLEEAYGGWSGSRLTQEEAAALLGVCARTFRRYVDRYEEEGLEGLRDKRLEEVSHRKAPVDEGMRLVDRYRSYHRGWNVRHFHAWYRRDGGIRSYTWVKKTLQQAGGGEAGPEARCPPQAPRGIAVGRMVHQDGSTHEWVPGQVWDLIVTMDDATNEHYSMFFCEEAGTWNSFRGGGT